MPPPRRTPNGARECRLTYKWGVGEAGLARIRSVRFRGAFPPPTHPPGGGEGSSRERFPSHSRVFAGILQSEPTAWRAPVGEAPPVRPILLPPPPCQPPHLCACTGCARCPRGEGAPNTLRQALLTTPHPGPGTLTSPPPPEGQPAGRGSSARKNYSSQHPPGQSRSSPGRPDSALRELCELTAGWLAGRPDGGTCSAWTARAPRRAGKGLGWARRLGERSVGAPRGHPFEPRPRAAGGAVAVEPRD